MEDEGGEERGKKLGKRVRACTTLYSLVSEFRRRTRCNSGGSARRNEAISRIREHRITTPVRYRMNRINYSWQRKKSFPCGTKYNPVASTTSRERTRGSLRRDSCGDYTGFKLS